MKDCEAIIEAMRRQLLIRAGVRACGRAGVRACGRAGRCADVQALGAVCRITDVSGHGCAESKVNQRTIIRSFYNRQLIIERDTRKV